MRIVLLVFFFGLACGEGHGAMSRGAEEGDAPPAKEMASSYAEAQAAAREGRCEEALRLVHHALSLDPTDAEAFNLRGYCLRKTGDLAGAFRAYETALKLRPDFPEARAYLAEAHIDAAVALAAGLAEDGPEGAAVLGEVAQALRRAAATVGTSVDGSAPQGDTGW